MSYASDCIRTLDYLLRKHDKLLRECAREVDTLRSFQTKDRPHPPLLTVEEHDRILALVRTSELTYKEIGKQVGRSQTIVCNIANGQHRFYDAKRCGPVGRKAQP